MNKAFQAISIFSDFKRKNEMLDLLESGIGYKRENTVALIHNHI